MAVFVDWGEHKSTVDISDEFGGPLRADSSDIDYLLGTIEGDVEGV